MNAMGSTDDRGMLKFHSPLAQNVAKTDNTLTNQCRCLYEG